MELTPETVEQFIAETCSGRSSSIDLGECAFAQIAGIVKLVLLVKHLALSGRDVELKIPRDLSVQRYLERANAFRELRDICRMDQSVDHLRAQGRYPTDTLVELRSIEEEGQIRAVVDGFVAGLTSQRNIRGDVIRAVESILYETLQNIPQHADPEGTIGVHNGLAALLRYSWRLCLSIGDLGVGIRKSLAMNPKFPMDKYDHGRAIEAAIGHASRHDDVGRGGGLPSVVSAVRKISGSLTVRSGDAMVVVERDNLQLKSCTEFPGTQLEIEVRLNR